MKKLQTITLLSFILLMISCSKDIEILVPIKDCKIIGSHSSFDNIWRYTNYNHEGDITSISNKQYIVHFERNLIGNELKLIYGDIDMYKKNHDTIFYIKKTNDPKIIRKLILSDNLILKLIDSQSKIRIEYEYSDNLMTKETAYLLSNNTKSYERKYIYDTADLFDNHDFHTGSLGEFLNIEHRIMGNFFKLNQLYLRYKEVSNIKYNLSGSIVQNHKYQYTYILNNRNLVSHKIINEVNEGRFKDTISYTYTCKW